MRLNNVDIYRSDGILSYTNNELKSDKHLTKYIDIPLNRRIIILQKSLSDNGTVFTYEQKGDSIFVNREMKLLYMLRRFCNQRVVKVYYPVTEAERSKVEKNIVEVQ